MADVACTGETLQKGNHLEDLHKHGRVAHNGPGLEYWNSLDQSRSY